MHSIKFIARIQYEIFGNKKSVDLEFFASSKDDAKVLARKLFKAEEDFEAAENVQVGVKYATPTELELENIRDKMVERLEPLKRSLNEKNYAEFLKGYVNFQGYDFKYNKEIHEESYLITCFGFTVRVIFNGIDTQIDEEEILYHSDTYIQDYVIKDNGVTILIGK